MTDQPVSGRLSRLGNRPTIESSPPICRGGWNPVRSSCPSD